MGAKSTNLTFGEAVGAMKKGGMLRRPMWPEGAYLFIQPAEEGQAELLMFHHNNGLNHRWMSRDDSSLLAEDWEIVG